LLARQRELAIRLAVGASRRQVVRLLAFENTVLAVSAGVIAMMAARWLFPVIFALVNRDDAYRYHAYLDRETLTCILVLTALAGLATLVAPVARFLGNPRTVSLKDGGTVKGESRRVGTIRNLLVVLQATFAVILLSGTGLMVRSFEKLHHVDLGFAPEGKIKVQILFSTGHAPTGLNARLDLFDRLQRKLNFLPGVEAASYGSDALLTGAFMGTAQLKMADGTFEPVAGSYVADDFNEAAGLRIIKGRWLSSDGPPNQVVINETLAKRRFGDMNPLGRTISIQVNPTPSEVIGVVKDVRDTVRSAAGMHIYFPNRISYPLNINTFVLRFTEEPAKGYEEVIRKAIYDFDPSLVAVTIVPMVDLVGDSMAAERYAFVILRGLTVVALILAMIGLFAVITFSVKARMQEFGVRTALGAVPSDLSRLVLKRGFSTVAVGLAVGIVASLGLTRFMQNLLFETTPYEPMVYLVVVVVLLVVALLACWLPARRAARVDPVIALRSE
jgi:putative ABC transport system permease protein